MPRAMYGQVRKVGWFWWSTLFGNLSGMRWNDGTWVLNSSSSIFVYLIQTAANDINSKRRPMQVYGIIYRFPSRSGFL
jgi:hypothetical protein